MKTPAEDVTVPPKKQAHEVRRSGRQRLKRVQYVPTLETNQRGYFRAKWKPKERQLLLRALKDVPQRRGGSAQSDFLAIKRRVITRTKAEVEQFVSYLRQKAGLKKIEDAKEKSPIEIWNDLVRDSGDNGEVMKAMTKAMMIAGSERVTQPARVKLTDFNPSQVYRYLAALMKQTQPPNLSPLESQVIVDCFESMLDLVKSSDIKEQTAFLQKQYHTLCDAAFTGGMPFDEDAALDVCLSGQPVESAGKHDGPSTAGRKGIWRGNLTGSKEARLLNPLGIPLELLRPCPRQKTKPKKKNQAENGGQDETHDEDDDNDDDDDDDGGGGFYRERASDLDKMPEEGPNNEDSDHHGDGKPDRTAGGEEGTSGTALADSLQQDDEDICQSSPTKPGFQSHLGPLSPQDVQRMTDQAHGFISDSNILSSPTKANTTESSDDEDFLMTVCTKMATGAFKGRHGQRQAACKISAEELLFGASRAEVEKELSGPSCNIRINRTVPILTVKSDDDALTEDVEAGVDSSQGPQSPTQFSGPDANMDDEMSVEEVSHAGNSPVRIESEPVVSMDDIMSEREMSHAGNHPVRIKSEPVVSKDDIISEGEVSHTGNHPVRIESEPVVSMDDIMSEGEMSHAGNHPFRIKSEPVVSMDDIISEVELSHAGNLPMRTKSEPVVNIGDLTSEDMSHAGNNLLRIDLSQLDPDSNIVIPASVLPGGILTIQSPGMSEEGDVVYPTTKQPRQVKPSSSLLLQSHKGIAPSGMGKNTELISGPLLTGQCKTSQAKEPIIHPKTEVIRTVEAGASSDVGSSSAIESSFEEEYAGEPTEIQFEKERPLHLINSAVATVQNHTEHKDIPKKRGRGRPRKEKQKNCPSKEDVAQPKRLRGRPPKQRTSKQLPQEVTVLQSSHDQVSGPVQSNYDAEKQKGAHLLQYTDEVGTEQIQNVPRDVPEKRGRGRPPKQRNSEQLQEKGTVLQLSRSNISEPVQPSCDAEKQKVAHLPVDALGTEQIQKEPRNVPEKRGRGRPPKRRISEQLLEKGTVLQSTQDKVSKPSCDAEKQKRGQLLEYNDAVGTVMSTKELRDVPEKRGRGRPPKQRNSEQLPEKGTVLQSNSNEVSIPVHPSCDAEKEKDVHSPKDNDDVVTKQIQKELGALPEKRGIGRSQQTTVQKAPAQSQAVAAYSEASNTMQGDVREVASRRAAKMQILLLSQALDAIAQIGKNLNASLNDLSSSVGGKEYIAPSSVTENTGLAQVIESMSHLGKSLDTGHSERHDDVRHSTVSYSERQAEKLHDTVVFDGDGKDKRVITHISSNGDTDVENVEQSTLNQADFAVKDSGTIYRSSKTKQELPAKSDPELFQDENRVGRQIRKRSDMGITSSKAMSGKRTLRSPNHSPIREINEQVTGITSSKATSWKRTVRSPDYSPIKENNQQARIKQEPVHIEDSAEEHYIGYSDGDSETKKEDETIKSNLTQQRKMRKVSASTEVNHSPIKHRRVHPLESLTSDPSSEEKSISKQRQNMRGSGSKGLTETDGDDDEQSLLVSPGHTNQEPKINDPLTFPKRNCLRMKEEVPRTSHWEGIGKFSDTSSHETLLACFNQEVRSPKAAVVFSLKKR